VVMLLGVLFLLPSERGPRRQAFYKDKAAVPADTKDWKAACLKLEKHIHTLRGEIEHAKVVEKNLQRDVLIQKEKIKKLQEKISQERGWQEREDADQERKGQEVVRLKETLKRVETEAQNEHGELLRLEREMKETRDSLSSINEVKRSLESQVLKLQAQNEATKKELADVRAQNAVLHKQHEETTWIAKPEYLKLEQQLRQVREELERLRNPPKREQ